MKKSIIISCVLAVFLVGTLFSLPKVVVNTKGKEMDTEKSAEKAAPMKEAATAETSTNSHDGATLSPEKQKIVD